MLRIYEYNSSRNMTGALDLQCPFCGNAAIGMIKKRVPAVVMENGGVLSFTYSNRQEGAQYDTDNKEEILYPDKVLCPQCETEMVSHSNVVTLHRERYHCPGCVICGYIEERIFTICSQCITSHGDYTMTPCGDCDYNYSRMQRGIDVGELKDQFGMEYVENDGQMEMFNLGVNKRRYYSNAFGKADIDGSW